MLGFFCLHVLTLSKATHTHVREKLERTENASTTLVDNKQDASGSSSDPPSFKYVVEIATDILLFMISR